MTKERVYYTSFSLPRFVKMLEEAGIAVEIPHGCEPYIRIASNPTKGECFLEFASSEGDWVRRTIPEKEITTVETAGQYL
jgi:hypothetical protein